MSDSHIASSAGRFEVRTTSDSHFGWLRTRLSVERTMMSWQRTAVALIGFGFAIVQYLNHLQQAPGARPGRTARLSSDRTGIFGTGADFMRHPGACNFALAVPVDGPLLVGRVIRANRRNESRCDKGEDPLAGHGGRYPPHLDWPVRVLCSAAPPHLVR